MERETKEERRALEEAEEFGKAQAALEEYYDSLPKRMMEAQALASEVGIRTSITLTPKGAAVTFHWPDDSNNYSYDEIINYETEPWELDLVETKLKELKAAKVAAELRLQIAKDVYAKLSETERACLKEFINYLR